MERKRSAVFGWLSMSAMNSRLNPQLVLQYCSLTGERLIGRLDQSEVLFFIFYDWLVFELSMKKRAVGPITEGGWGVNSHRTRPI